MKNVWKIIGMADNFSKIALRSLKEIISQTNYHLVILSSKRMFLKTK